MEWLWNFYWFFYLPESHANRMRHKSLSDRRTVAWRYCDSLPMYPSVCLKLFSYSLLPSYASSINLFQLIVLKFRYFFYCWFHFQVFNDYCLRMSKLSFVIMCCFLNSSFSLRKHFLMFARSFFSSFVMNTRNYLSYQLTITSSAVL